jgi:hypothetical protein
MFEILAQLEYDFDYHERFKQLGCSPDKARATLNNLQNKLKNYPKLSPFIGIESYGKGAYRLAVKRRILEQEHND